MKIDTLKQQAREHELAEEWEKALSLYRRAVDALREAEEPDIALLNRMADLQVRSGDLEGAMESYDEAIELYLESDLPNNAIAICRKMLRHAPDRPEIFRKIGKIRAGQGFVVDARQSYLTYAEMMEARGERETAVEGLREFISILPDDVETRLFLGRQYLAREAADEGISHLLHAWTVLRREGNEERAESIEDEIRGADPEVVFPDPAGGSAREPEGEEDEDDGIYGFESTGLEGLNFGAPGDVADDAGEFTEAEELDAFDFDLDSDDDEVEEAVADVEEPAEEFDLPDSDATEPQPQVEGVDESWDDLRDDEVVEEAFVPDFEVDEEDEEEEIPESSDPLPLITDEGDSGDAPVPEAIELDPGFEDPFGSELEEEPEPEPVPEFEPEPAPELNSAEGVRAWIAEAPDDPERHQALVEVAYRTDDRGLLLDAFLGLAGALAASGEEEKAHSVYEQVIQLDPGNRDARTALGRPLEVPETPEVSELEESPPATPEEAPQSEFIDLGSLILDDNEEAGTTRWVAAGHEPSGDEGSDFADMLSDFKEKVSRNLDHQDARSQYDLGTAYREMGLLDEAIAMFQSSLRAQPDHLGAIEMMGQCFLEKDEPRMAIRVMQRALNFGHPIEDDLLGIYYYLGEAHERVGNPDESREFYEKVFALDINFKDVTDRLRSLR